VTRTRYVRIGVEGGGAELRERAAAEAFEAGALGVEERDGPPPALWVYATDAAAGQVRAALAPLRGLAVGEAEALPERAWSEAWKEGLEAIEISPRLVVRPSFAPAPAGFAGAELVIDPGQAFGTGGHASTRLALEAIDALPAQALRGARVLDVGCGTGVLALAALALGAARALGCDLDPLATAAARETARANGFADRLALVTGSPAALGPRAEGRFDLVVANLLRSELEPLVGDLARRVRPRGVLIVSGLLASDRGALERTLAAQGLAATESRSARDSSGDAWVALTTRRSAPRSRAAPQRRGGR
jgi:ribosomal protein L11 methyltransferase